MPVRRGLPDRHAAPGILPDAQANRAVPCVAIPAGSSRLRPIGCAFDAPRGRPWYSARSTVSTIRTRNRESDEARRIGGGVWSGCGQPVAPLGPLSLGGVVVYDNAGNRVSPHRVAKNPLVTTESGRNHRQARDTVCALP